MSAADDAEIGNPDLDEAKRDYEEKHQKTDKPANPKSKAILIWTDHHTGRRRRPPPFIPTVKRRHRSMKYITLQENLFGGPERFQPIITIRADDITSMSPLYGPEEGELRQPPGEGNTTYPRQWCRAFDVETSDKVYPCRFMYPKEAESERTRVIRELNHDPMREVGEALNRLATSISSTTSESISGRLGAIARALVADIDPEAVAALGVVAQAFDDAGKQGRPKPKYDNLGRYK